MIYSTRANDHHHIHHTYDFQQMITIIVSQAKHDTQDRRVELVSYGS